MGVAELSPNSYSSDVIRVAWLYTFTWNDACLTCDMNLCMCVHTCAIKESRAAAHSGARNSHMWCDSIHICEMFRVTRVTGYICVHTCATAEVRSGRAASPSMALNAMSWSMCSDLSYGSQPCSCSDVVWYSVVQYVTLCHSVLHLSYGSQPCSCSDVVWYSGAVCYSVSQCVAACCSVFQCATACCSVL